MKKTLIVLMMVLLAAVLIVSCDDKLNKVCTVTFASNGGSSVSEVEVQYGEKVTKPTDPTKDGYVLAKWTTDEDGTKEYDFDSVVEGDITLYAQWAKAYTVTFASNGGSSVAAELVKEGEKVTKPADPTKDGFEFSKWTTDEEGNTEYTFESPVTENITLYAQWSVKVYKVTFASMGGSAVATADVKHGEKVTKPANPKKSDWVFDKWTTDETGNTEYSFNSAVTDNITLYAQWRDYYIVGDTGPAGGLVFYDKSSYSDGWRYLEAAPSDLASQYFGYTNDNTQVVSGDNKAIGTGYSNTISLVEKMDKGNGTANMGNNNAFPYAAYECQKYSVTVDGKIYKDWFLPSLNELKEMYNTIKDKYSFQGVYWSSSEEDGSKSYYFNLTTGDSGSAVRNNPYYVRPIRRF